MAQEFDDTEFLGLANTESGGASIDRLKKNQEKEKEPSFWSKGMENLVPEAFKGGKKNTPTAQKNEEKEDKEKSKRKELAKARLLVRKHNAYMRSQSIRAILEEGGYQSVILPPTTSLTIVEEKLEEINTIRSAHQARNLAKYGMKMLNKLTESFIPELGGVPSLSDFWDAQSEVDGSSVQLDMEELAIELEPHISLGFWGRFAGDYVMIVQQLRALKSSPQFRAQMAAQENLSQRYDSDLENEGAQL
jgi:hypothetical protein